MMDAKTREVVRALVVQLKSLMDYDDSSHLALLENAERTIAESADGMLGAFRLTGLSTTLDLSATFDIERREPRTQETLFSLLQSKRVITLYVEEGMK